MGCTGLMPELAEGKFLFKTLLAPELRIKLMGGHKTLSSFQALSELALATDAIMASKHKAMAALQLTCVAMPHALRSLSPTLMEGQQRTHRLNCARHRHHDLWMSQHRHAHQRCVHAPLPRYTLGLFVIALVVSTVATFAATFAERLTSAKAGMLPVQPPMPAAVIAAAKAKSDGKTPRIFAV
nr:hypothetical protein HK105_005124 [Polyrhizophydium stewartii]